MPAEVKNFCEHALEAVGQRGARAPGRGAASPLRGAPRKHGTPRSIYTRSAEIALAEKKIPYALAAIPIGAHRVTPHLAKPPFAKVPVIDHDGVELHETQAILRYVDQEFPGEPLQPSESREAARMSQIVGVAPPP